MGKTPLHDYSISPNDFARQELASHRKHDLLKHVGEETLQLISVELCGTISGLTIRRAPERRAHPSTSASTPGAAAHPAEATSHPWPHLTKATT